MIRVMIWVSLLLGGLHDLWAQDFFEGSLVFEVKAEGPQAEMMAVNEPNDKLTLHLNPTGDYIVHLSGGRYPKVFMFLADSNYEYSMDMANRRAFRFSSHADLNHKTDTLDLRARPTGRADTVKGVTLQEYVLRKPGEQFLFYVSDDYRVNKAAFPPDCRAKASFLAEGLEGRIPLKTIKKTKDITVTTTLTGLKPQTFSKDQFMIPPGFEVKGRDYRY
jgi:hypothetical protein